MLSLRFLIGRIALMPFYAVRVGRANGIYQTWNECERQVAGFSNAKFKKFATLAEAEQFMHGTNDKTPDETTKKLNFKPLIPNVKPSAENQLSSNQNATTKSGKLVVYVDGACSQNGAAMPRAGYGVFWGHNHPLNVAKRLKGKQTNNRAEYQAAIFALKQAVDMQLQQDAGVTVDGLAAPLRELEIRTDSRLMLKSITEWLPTWRRNGWITGQGTKVKNRADIVKLDELRNAFEARGGKVLFVHVAGHSGEPGNDAADQLAREGASLAYRSRSSSSSSVASSSSGEQKTKRSKTPQKKTDSESSSSAKPITKRKAKKLSGDCEKSDDGSGGSQSSEKPAKKRGKNAS